MSPSELRDAVSDIDCSTVYEERNMKSPMHRLMAINSLYLLGASSDPKILMARLYGNLTNMMGFRQPRND